MSASVQISASATRMRQRIGPIHIDRTTRSLAVERILDFIEKHERIGPALVIPVNAQLVQLSLADPSYAQIVTNADLVLPDGVSLAIAARIFGNPLPERLPGIDMISIICEALSKDRRSIYLLGGAPGAAEATAGLLRKRYPRLKVVGTDCPPMGFDDDPIQDEQVVQRVCDVRPDILFVGFGAPKQERWMMRNAARLPVKVMMGVGGSFDILSGAKRRAPEWMRRAGLEWAYRLWHEPNRLWKRNAIGFFHMLVLIFGHLMGRYNETISTVN